MVGELDHHLQRLQVMVELIPVLKDYFNNVATFTIQTITANLSSKNRDINDAAVLALDALIEHLGRTVPTGVGYSTGTCRLA